MNSKYPKVVILFETFSSKSGGGITLTNLFKNWPKDRIANIVDAAMISQINNKDICNNYYGLGEFEKKTLPLFSFFTTKFKSGNFSFSTDSISTAEGYFIEKKTIKNIISKLFWDFTKFIGLYHTSNKYVVSNELLLWLQEFKPDIIYSQLSNYEMVCFTNELIEKYNARLAVHIMDDWFTTFKNKGLFKSFWQNKLNSELKEAIGKADITLSISEGMSVEYLKRFNKTFIPFHNPIETEIWKSHTKSNLEINQQKIEILYAGRIGKGTSESVVEIADAIDELNRKGFNIKFKIQTTIISQNIKVELSSKRCVIFNPVVNYTELPGIFSAADILVMPVDFSDEGKSFLQYSMPTKASEYMISGTPILLYCHPNVSLCKHAIKYKWAYVVSENNSEKLISGITELLVDYELRQKLSKFAVKFSLANYDSIVVRENFRSALNSEINTSL